MTRNFTFILELFSFNSGRLGVNSADFLALDLDLGLGDERSRLTGNGRVWIRSG